MSEVIEMVQTMVEMPDEKFNECMEFAEQMNVSELVREFIRALIETAVIERQKKTIQSA